MPGCVPATFITAERDDDYAFITTERDDDYVFITTKRDEYFATVRHHDGA